MPLIRAQPFWLTKSVRRYCSYILIYDIKQENWYIANVNRWFRLHPIMDESRFAEVRTYKFANVEQGLKAMPHKLEDHLLSEIHNSHFFISMFKVHLRSMYSYESRTLAFLIKLIGVFFGSWMVQELHLFHHHVVDDTEPTLEDIHFDADSIKIVIIIDIISYVFVIPYMLIVRSSFMSGLIQRKTTNPLNVDVIRKEQSSVVVEKKHNGKSTKGSGKSIGSKQDSKMKSVLFQVQESTDTMESGQSWIVQEQPKPQKSWAVSHVQHSRARKLLTLLFGPSQFRCINVSNQIFDVKMFRRILYSRFLAGVFILSGLATIFFVLQFTNIGAKYSVTLFYVVLVITIDICVLNPIVNLLQTIVMFKILQTSNREYNYWSESTKVDLPKPLSLREYFHTAIKPTYKPLLSCEIEKIKKKSTLYSSIRTCILYSYVILCLLLTAYVLSTRYDMSYYMLTRTTHAATEYPKLGYDIRSGDIRSSISGVNRPKKVEEFIQSTFAELLHTWPNKKRMDPVNEDRRFLDRVSKVMGPASVLITRMSAKKQKKIPKYFTEHYNKAYGFLAESEIEKSPIILAGRELNYTTISPTTILRGRSGTTYGMDGNQAIITIFPHWDDYYVSLISSMKVWNSTEHHSALILRTSIIFLALLHIAFASIDISTLGFNNYITHWYGRTKVALSVSGVMVCITTLTFYFPKNLMLDMFFRYPSDRYIDLHQLHHSHGVDSIALAFFLLVMCTDLAVAIKNALTLKIISAISSQGAHLMLSMYLIIMIYSRAAASSANVLSNDFDFMVLFFNKGMFPLAGRDGENQFFVLVAIVIICVFSKFCLAIFIYNLEASDWDFVSEYHPGRPVTDRFKIQPLRSTREVKMRYLKKHSVKSTVSSRKSDHDHELPQFKKSITSQKSGHSRDTIISRQNEEKRDTHHVRIQLSEQEESSEDRNSPENKDGSAKLEARTSKLSQKIFQWF